MVRSFGRGNNKETYLSTGKKGSQIEMVGDAEEEEEEVKRIVWRQVENAVVVAVPLFDTYASCLKCSCKVVADEGKGGTLGRCGKCGMLQWLDWCKYHVHTTSCRSRECDGHPSGFLEGCHRHYRDD